MNKTLTKILSALEYIFMLVATIAVLASQFLPYLALVLIGLISYVVSFFLASIRSIKACIEIFRASKMVVGENEALVASSKVEVLNSKKEKALSVLSAIFWISICIFALIVLILYPKTF